MALSKEEIQRFNTQVLGFTKSLQSTSVHDLLKPDNRAELIRLSENLETMGNILHRLRL